MNGSITASFDPETELVRPCMTSDREKTPKIGKGDGETVPRTTDKTNIAKVSTRAIRGGEFKDEGENLSWGAVKRSRHSGVEKRGHHQQEKRCSRVERGLLVQDLSASRLSARAVSKGPIYQGSSVREAN